MRIAIVSVRFHVGRAYHENNWFLTGLDLGHEVRVYTSDIPYDGLTPGDLGKPPYGGRVMRLATRRLPFSFFRTDEERLYSALEDYGPDLILHIGHNAGFGAGVRRYKRNHGSKVRVACFNGENSGVHRYAGVSENVSFGDWIRTRLWRTLRGPLTVAALRQYDLVVCTTAETKRILQIHLPVCRQPKYERKLSVLPLCYRGEVNHLDSSLRAKVRRELSVEESTLILVSSRIAEGKIRKYLRGLTRAIAKAASHDDQLTLLVVGFQDGSTVSKAFESELRRNFPVGRLLTESLADQRRLNALYNAADVVVFPAASNSIQQAMGAGAYVLLADIGGVEHLLDTAEQGMLYEADSDGGIAVALGEAVRRSRATSRSRRATLNAGLECRRLFRRLLDEMDRVSGSERSGGLSSPSTEGHS